MNNRMERVNSQIKREVAKIIDEELTNSILREGIITVNKVDTAPDFSRSKIFVSMLGIKNKEETLKILKKTSGLIRYKLAQKLQFRKTPSLSFIFDESVEYGVKIDKIIKELND